MKQFSTYKRYVFCNFFIKIMMFMQNDSQSNMFFNIIPNTLSIPFIVSHFAFSTSNSLKYDHKLKIICLHFDKLKN